MPSCSICKNNFAHFKQLVIHLKIIHDINGKRKISCNENQCFRDFTSLNSFRKHYQKIHLLSDTQNLKESDTISEVEAEDRDNIGASVENLLTSPDFNTELNTHDNENVTENLPCSSIPKICNNDSENIVTEKLPACNYQSLLLFENELRSSTLSFITDMYAVNTLTRKHVQFVIDSTSNLLKKPLNIFSDVLESYTQKYKFIAEDANHLHSFLHQMQHIFQGLETEYRRFAFLEKSKFYIPPIEYILGQRYDNFKNNVASPQDYKAQYVSIGKVLTAIFQLPNVLSNILYYLEELNCADHLISNITQTKYWQNKIKEFDRTSIVLPLFIYFDEYESGNPLGSHSGIHKLGAIYFSLPFIPPAFRAKLHNIFLTVLFHSADLKDFGSKIVFSKLIEECNELESTGIIIKNSNKTYKIYLCAALFLGDNLGLNTMLGYVQSFHANYYCRFCKCHRSEMEKQVVQKDNTLRNRINYQTDLNLNNVTETGIKEECVLNLINSFHVTENFAVDISHDIFEGVALYDITNILYQFIITDKLFSIEILNYKLKYFNYGNESNIPPLISLDNLKKKKMHMTCAEMKCFILYIGLILGPLIPEGNIYWELYILLRKLLNIVLRDFVDNASCDLLKSVIEKHHTLYMSLFNTTLKPKYHNLVHYPLHNDASWTFKTSIMFVI